MKMFDRRHSFFQYPWLGKFIAACQTIQSDPNYQPGITKVEIQDLFWNNHLLNDGKYAIAIQPFDINPLFSNMNSIGMMYQVNKVYGYFINKYDDYPPYLITRHDEKVILVNKNGVHSVHDKKLADQGNFNSPLPSHYDINNFLNQECLHYQEEIKAVKTLVVSPSSNNTIERMRCNKNAISNPHNLLKSHSFFQSFEKSFLIENRHQNDKLQHEYDRRFGLTTLKY